MNAVALLRPAFAASLLAAAFAGFGASPAAGSGSTFGHDDWGRVLAERVDEKGFVDYEGLAVDRETFDGYITRVRKISPDSDPSLFPSRAHELAYWINAYNAHVFAGVLARGPETESVWSGLISGRKFFVAMDIEVGGRKTNLKKLEDDIIRERYQDPRIHAAINCASISCPRLPREPFLADELDSQLDAAMREFVADERHVTVDVGSKTVRLSKIFDWFAGDFLDFEKRQGNDNPSVLDYINRYRPADRQVDRDLGVEYIPYDKGINAQGNA